MHWNDGGFDVVDVHIPFCEVQGSGIHGSDGKEVNVDVVVAIVGSVI